MLRVSSRVMVFVADLVAFWTAFLVVEVPLFFLVPVTESATEAATTPVTAVITDFRTLEAMLFFFFLACSFSAFACSFSSLACSLASMAACFSASFCAWSSAF